MPSLHLPPPNVYRGLLIYPVFPDYNVINRTLSTVTKQFSSANIFNRITEHTLILQQLYAAITPGPLERTFGPTKQC